MPILYRFAAYAVVVIAAFLAGYMKGQAAEQIAQLKATIVQTVLVRKQEAAAVAAVAAVEKTAAVKAETIRTVYKTITKEVVKYAATDNGHSFDLGPTWMREHDAAANPETIPAAPGGLVNNAEVLAVVVANYETCNDWRAKLIRWQNWYEASGLVATVE